MASNTISTTFYIAVSTLTYLVDPLKNLILPVFRYTLNPGFMSKVVFLTGGIFLGVFNGGYISYYSRSVKPDNCGYKR